MTSELRSAQFRREREQDWLRLERLLDRLDRGSVRSLAADELTQLPHLYRSAISSLSVARAISLDLNLVDYLEALAARAYFHVYAPPRGFWRTIGVFLRVTFPRAFRRNRWFIVLSTTFMLLGGAIAYGMTRSDPDHFYLFVPEELSQGRGPTATAEELRQSIYRPVEAEEALSEFASYLFSNNARVAMLCFALGIVPLVAVFYLIFFNGA
ncbi:MAG: stage II sporulation protein M, partial [Planctomycetes bacterium]|nr:stage II sporulation protein M [Planctomycetota bacterium]